MVTFVSLFLWLIAGIHPVEVAVEGPVASVEILLDGEKVGVAMPPDWRLDCDFGAALRPHELVAVALDETGAELNRARQVVNLPRPKAEVEIVLEESSSGRPEAVQVVTQNALWLEPEIVEVTFDQQLLTGDGGRFSLPEYDPDETHLLSVEARFPDGVTARDDISFSGRYGGRVATELTAVPIVVEGKRRPKPAELEGSLRARGQALRVAAVERPGARVYLVRDYGAWPTMQAINFEMIRRSPWLEGAALKRGTRLESAEELSPEIDRFHLVVPNAIRRRKLEVFPVVGPYHLRPIDLSWLASHVYSQDAAVEGQKVAAAVAVAGVRAARDGGPRTVILMLSENVADASVDRAGDVREYLRALRVPLVVWSTAGGGTAGGWGEAAEVSDETSLNKASKRVLKELKRQWIVWVEGRYLPGEIELDQNAQDIRLAG
jgi:hypothetical protein